MKRIAGTRIRLIGPGGAGKTTIGAALAERLGVVFVDLDRQFAARTGDISAYLRTHDYRTYAARNVEVYWELLRECGVPSVWVLSSGFMTYPCDIHPAYRNLHSDIVRDSSTIVLLPSFDYETCVAETVRRQLDRAFARSPDQEGQVIRARFAMYRRLPVRQFETMRPVERVVDDLVAYLLPKERLDHAPLRLKPADHGRGGDRATETRHAVLQGWHGLLLLPRKGCSPASIFGSGP